MSSTSAPFRLGLINIPAADIPAVCDILEEIADTMIDRGVGIYNDRLNTLRHPLENSYSFRFTTFRHWEIDGYITDATIEQQAMFVLFCAEMVRCGCGEQSEPAFYISPQHTDTDPL